jgi:hypothetical protein
VDQARVPSSATVPPAGGGDPLLQPPPGAIDLDMESLTLGVALGAPQFRDGAVQWRLAHTGAMVAAGLSSDDADRVGSASIWWSAGRPHSVSIIGVSSPSSMSTNADPGDLCMASSRSRRSLLRFAQALAPEDSGERLCRFGGSDVSACLAPEM